jgi:hypothetical protein
VTERWKNRRLPWYAEERAREGSFAAFVGLVFETADDILRWHVLAIGDSCLVQTRSEKVILAFPISEPDQFGFQPLLLPSKAERQATVAESVLVRDGTAEKGDEFYLLSDSIANWFLQGKRANASSISDFERLLSDGSTNELDILFDEQRAAMLMRNDDIAAVHVRVVFGIFASIAEFERELIRDRVRSGLAAARARGKSIGRPRVAVDVRRIESLRRQGRSWAEITRETGISKGTAQRAQASSLPKTPAAHTSLSA